MIKRLHYDVEAYGEQLKEKLKQHGIDYLSTIPEADQYKVDNALTVMMAYESQDTLSELLGEPASHLNVLCDVNFSKKLALPIYNHIGVPHFILANTMRESLDEDLYPPQAIKANAPDTEVFKHAKDHGFDAIISKDYAQKDDQDLCVIATHHFNDKANSASHLPIVIIPQRQKAQLKFIKEHGLDVISRIHKAETPFIDLTEEHANNRSDQKPSTRGQWLQGFLAKKNSNHDFDDGP